MSRARDLADGTFSGAFSADSPTLVVDDANNRVGVGTTSPSSLLDVDKSQNAETNIELTNTNTGSAAQVRTKYTTDGGLFTVGKTSNAHAYGGDAYVYNVDNTNIRFGTNDTERARIHSGGQLSINTTGNSVSSRTCKITVAQANTTGFGLGIDAIRNDTSGSGGIVTRNNETSGTFDVMSILNSGGTEIGIINANNSAVGFTSTSDYRLKENVVDLTGAIDRVKTLQPKRFNFISDPDVTVDGFIAHEVSDAVPEAVAGTKDAMRDEEYEVTPAVLDDDGNVVTEAVMGTRQVPKYQGIDPAKLVPLLTAAIKEQQALIEDLQTRLAALEAV